MTGPFEKYVGKVGDVSVDPSKWVEEDKAAADAAEKAHEDKKESAGGLNPSLNCNSGRIRRTLYSSQGLSAADG